MNKAITFVRIPFGSVVTALVVGFWAIAFLAIAALELIAVIPVFILLSVFANKEEMRTSWVGTFPNCIRDIGKKDGYFHEMTKFIKGVWEWVLNPESKFD